MGNSSIEQEARGRDAGFEGRVEGARSRHESLGVMVQRFNPGGPGPLTKMGYPFRVLDGLSESIFSQGICLLSC